MPLINKITTLVSNSGTTWYSTLSRQDAINGAILGSPTPFRNTVQSFSRQFPFWPELKYYPAVSAANPDYVWNVSQPPDAPANGPGTLFFAQAFTLSTAPVPNTDNFHLATTEAFSDNAAALYIEEIIGVPMPDSGIVNVSFTKAVVIGTINGTLNDAGQASSPPFPWETISKFSSSYLTTLPGLIPEGSQYYFVVSFEATNYSPNGVPDPAGLQFIVELFGA